MATPPERAVDLISDEPLTAYVASASNETPHVTPVWYVYHEGRLEFFARGTLLSTLRENPTVAVTIPTDVPGYGDWHISMRGEATVIDDVERINETARRLFPTYVDGWPDRWNVGTEKLTTHPDDALVVVNARMLGSLSTTEGRSTSSRE